MSEQEKQIKETDLGREIVFFKRTNEVCPNCNREGIVYITKSGQDEPFVRMCEHDDCPFAEKAVQKEIKTGEQPEIEEAPDTQK